MNANHELLCMRLRGSQVLRLDVMPSCVHGQFAAFVSLAAHGERLAIVQESGGTPREAADKALATAVVDGDFVAVLRLP